MPGCVHTVSAEEASFTVARPATAASGAGSPVGGLNRLDSAAYAYSFRSVTSDASGGGSVGYLSRANSLIEGTGAKEVSLAVLLKRLPDSAVAYLDDAVMRMTNTRRRAGLTAVNAATNAVAAPAEGEAPEERPASAGDSPATEVAPAPANTASNDEEAALSPVSVEQVDNSSSSGCVKQLLGGGHGFTTLASEVLSTVLMDLLQDTLSEVTQYTE